MTDVAKIDLPYVQAFKDRHGRMRYYFRRKGYVRHPLSDTPGTEAFAASYQAALAASKPATTLSDEGPRSIGALIDEYYLSSDFKKNLKASTQAGHAGVLEAFRKAAAKDGAPKYGTLSVIGVKAIHLNVILHKMADRPAQASNLRKRLTTIFDLAEDLGWITAGSNPAKKTRRVKYRTAGFEPWTDEDIARYEAHWPSGSRERLALYLLLYTGQRRSDVRVMGHQHIEGGRISVAQRKTDKRLKIKLHPALAAEVASAPKGMSLLMTQYGSPFTDAGFTGWFVERAKKAGIEGKSPHGLRKAAGRRLAEAGCSAKEIAAVLGHDSLAMVDLYTRDANQADLADAGIDRLRQIKG